MKQCIGKCKQINFYNVRVVVVVVVVAVVVTVINYFCTFGTVHMP